MVQKMICMAMVVLCLCFMATTSVFGALGDKTLTQGSRGDDVKELQKRLVQLGYAVGKIDGAYGSKTVAAVKKFQQNRGLKADGVAGKETIAVLKKMTGESQTVSGKAVGYKDSDYQLLARAVSAEARGEPYLGQVAVAAVILNRIESSSFPNTIAGIVYQDKAFSSVADGQINQEPVESAIKAAKEALRGYDPTHGAIYFFNPAKTSNRFIWSRPQIMKIGNHIFAR